VIFVLERLEYVAKALGRKYKHYALEDLAELAYEAAVGVLRDYRPEHGELAVFD
jgi:hypothetical protein